MGTHCINDHSVNDVTTFPFLHNLTTGALQKLFKRTSFAEFWDSWKEADMNRLEVLLD